MTETFSFHFSETISSLLAFLQAKTIIGQTRKWTLLLRHFRCPTGNEICLLFMVGDNELTNPKTA